jgi:hypothetical protein
VLLAPFLSPGCSLDDASSLRRANAHCAALVRGRGGRDTSSGRYLGAAPRWFCC